MMTRPVACLLLLMGLIGTSAAAVDDATVKRWIAASILGKVPAAGEVQPAVDATYQADRVKTGWAALKVCRDAGNSANLGLAAAEHYMFARFLGTLKGDTTLTALPSWYETVKSIATRAGFENYLRSSNQPLSKIDPAVTHWGEAGVAKGLADYKANEHRDPSAGFTSTLVMLYFAYDRYSEKPSGGMCKVKI